MVSLITDGLGGFDVSWGEEAMVFVGHSVKAECCLCTCFSFFLFFFFSIILVLFKVQTPHPPSPLHTRRLKSQHHEIFTTFPNSTPRYGFALGAGVHLPLPSPALRFIPLGFLHSGLLDFVFF